MSLLMVSALCVAGCAVELGTQYSVNDGDEERVLYDVLYRAAHEVIDHERGLYSELSRNEALFAEHTRGAHQASVLIKDAREALTSMSGGGSNPLEEALEDLARLAEDPYTFNGNSVLAGLTCFSPARARELFALPQGRAPRPP